MLVREDTEVRIPSLIDQKVNDLTGSVQVDFVLRRIEQDHERTGDITSDLRGDGFVFLYFGAVVAGHSTLGALDAGVEEPLSGARRRVSSKQANSLTPPIYKNLNTPSSYKPLFFSKDALRGINDLT